MERIDRSYIRHVRYAVQWSIVLFLLYAGHEFYRFVNFYFSGGTGAAAFERQPSVEGFLPIGGLMALKLWITTGFFDIIHPAGLVIFIAAVLMALLLKKGFCGWICPVGALSDVTWKLGGKIFGRNFIVPRYLDYTLRSMKYLFMAFFLFVVVIKMPSPAISEFLASDYYKIADVKMLFFFTNMTTATSVTLVALFILSLFFRNFWCRYLCPYGALLGIISVCSPLKITRDETDCISCGKCAKSCPALLAVDRKARVGSPECTGCLTCVSNCPAKGALDIAVTRKAALNPLVYAVLAVALFFGAIGIGKVAGRWSSAATPSDYGLIIPQASSLEHP